MLMRRIFAVLILLSTCCDLHAEPPKELFPAPHKLSENKELPRPDFVSFRKKEHAFENERDSSPNVVDLSGFWKYRVYESAGKVPKEITQGEEVIEKFTEKWDTVKIPLPNPEFFDKKTNRSSVVVFSRKFILPFDLFDKAHFLHIGAVNSAVTLYVNGERIGFSQEDTKNPTEFELTGHIAEGVNWVTLIVSQSAAVAGLEKKQTIGIDRDIYLFAQPKIRMRDYLVRTTLDGTYTNGFLETAMLLKTQLLNPHPVKVHYDLYNPDGQLVNSGVKDVEVGLKAEDTVRFTASIPNVLKWNAETPNLYTIMYRIQRNGRFTEYVACKIGFRSIEIQEDKLLINGKPAQIKGVNITEKADRSTLEELKWKGVNALRVPGPMPEQFYRWCDELGFYVCDMANINTSWQPNSRYKGSGSTTNDPAWKSDYLARVNNTLERNKNHSSVIMWATGDRSGNGYNMYHSYLLMKSKDDVRPIVYDGAAMEWNTDIYMPTIGERANYQEEKAYGDWWNGVGQEQDYRNAGRPYIPSWIELKTGESLPEGSQGAFLAAGTSGKIVEALYSAFEITQVDARKGVYRFRNNMDFTDSEHFTVNYKLTDERGKVQKEGILNVAAAPGEEVEITVPNVGSVGNGKKLTFTIGNFCKKTF